jgi:hypothetical protein
MVNKVKMRLLVLTALVLASAPAAAQNSEDSVRDLSRFSQKMKLELRGVFSTGMDFKDPALGDFAWAAEVDPWARRGRVSLGAGRDDTLSLHFDAKFDYEGHGATRTRMTIDLAVADHHFEIVLPDMHMRITTVYGEACFEATVPMIEGRF